MMGPTLGESILFCGSIRVPLPVHCGGARPGRPESNFTDHEYKFFRSSGCAATVSKQWFAWTDTYGVEIAEGEDDILILASTVVVDMACHGDQERR